MHPHHLYMLNWARRIAATEPTARILDFGCGAGELVVAGRDSGLDIVGADIFYDGSSSRQEVKALGLLGTAIKEIVDGRLPYDDDSFALVVANQVIEHTVDLDRVLAEIARVLKRRGKLVCTFPTRETVREGHIGIPFVHWFDKRSPIRFRYAFLCRAMGFGYFKDTKSIRQWTNDHLDWMDKYTSYRAGREVEAALAKYFTVTPIESDYVRFRLERALAEPRTALARVLDAPLVSGLSRALLRRLSGMVLLAEKP